MKYRNEYRIGSTRLPYWDYRNSAYYYITIVTKSYKHWFGMIKNDRMILNPIGRKAKHCIESISRHYPTVVIPHYIIMPNHVRAIIFINDCERQVISKPSLGNIVGSIKAAVSKWAKEQECHGFAWQSRFYDRIIRNEDELHNIFEYIESNPLNWRNDHYNEQQK